MEVIINEAKLENREEFNFMLPLIDELRNNRTPRSIYFPDVSGSLEATAEIDFDFNGDYAPMGIVKFTCRDLGMKMDSFVEVKLNKSTQPETVSLRFAKFIVKNKVTQHSVTMGAVSKSNAVHELINNFAVGGRFRKIVKI